MNVLSLFSGCGGMDIGFEGGFTCLKRSINIRLHPDWIDEDHVVFARVKKTGFRTVFANDILKSAKDTWESYFNKNTFRLASIVDLVKQSNNGIIVFPENVDVVTGGFPCQDFSIAGKRLGFNSQKSHTGGKLQLNEPSIESRGKLYMWMRDVINIVQPKMFVAENVKGLTDLGDVQQIIEHDFADNGGYIVVPAKVINAADYGVPQSRQRVIFFGFKKSALSQGALEALTTSNIPSDFDPYPPITHAYTIKDDSLYTPVTCREAFTNLNEPENTYDPDQQAYSRCKFLGKRCQGQREIVLNGVAPTIRSEHHGNIEYRRLSAAHGGKETEGLTERRLTVRECARLQTFPDNYQFIPTVTASDAYKLIGNAVPCVMAYNIAMNLAEKWQLYFGN